MFQLLSHRYLSLPFAVNLIFLASLVLQNISGSPNIKLKTHYLFQDDQCYFVKEIPLQLENSDNDLLYLKVGDQWANVLGFDKHKVTFHSKYADDYFVKKYTNVTHLFFKDDTDINEKKWKFSSHFVSFDPQYENCNKHIDPKDIHFVVNGIKYLSGEISVVGYKSLELYCVLKPLTSRTFKFIWNVNEKIYDSTNWLKSYIPDEEKNYIFTLKQKFENTFTKDDNGKNLQCQTSVQNGLSVMVTLKVEYAPRIMIKVNETIISPLVALTLKCEADANPSSTQTAWIESKTDQIIFTKLNISEAREFYTCESINKINRTFDNYSFLKDKWLPKIMNKFSKEHNLLFYAGSTIILKVNYDYVILDNWEWFFNDGRNDILIKGKPGYIFKEMNQNWPQKSKERTLEIINSTEKHSGKYTFSIDNGLGVEKCSIKVTILINEHKNTEWQYILGIVVSFSVGLIAVVGIKLHRKKTSSFNNTGNDCFASEKRSPDLRHNRSRRPYVISMEIDRQSPRATFHGPSEIIPCMSVRCLSLLGVGCFGEVYRARVLSQSFGASHNDYYVAVKFLKQSGIDAENKFLHELQIHTHLPPHRNVIKCFGKTLVDGAIGMVLEYSPNGNLKDLLKRTYSEALPRINRKDRSYCELLTYKCLKYAREIASGMAHITNYKLLHRDLAARNILLGENNICKITDFGLARQVSNELDYIMNSNDLIPVRWLSPEALISRIYSEKSDVWSFGIILWEIIALGGTPYYNLKNGFQVKEALLSGYRMNVPKHCSREISVIMESCWRESPSDRPNFTRLENEFTSLLELKGGYLNFKDYDTNLYSEMSPDVYREEVNRDCNSLSIISKSGGETIEENEALTCLDV